MQQKRVLKSKTTETALTRIKERIIQIGLSIPGTIRTTYLRCGKPACACAADERAKHGPYFFWTRRVNGRLTSKSVHKDLVKLYEGWIQNRLELEKLVQELLELGQAVATNEDDRSLQPVKNISSSSVKLRSRKC